jgi:hypothetical protein
MGLSVPKVGTFSQTLLDKARAGTLVEMKDNYALDAQAFPFIYTKNLKDINTATKYNTIGDVPGIVLHNVSTSEDLDSSYHYQVNYTTKDYGYISDMSIDLYFTYDYNWAYKDLEMAYYYVSRPEYYSLDNFVSTSNSQIIVDSNTALNNKTITFQIVMGSKVYSKAFTGIDLTTKDLSLATLFPDPEINLYLGRYDSQSITLEATDSSTMEAILVQDMVEVNADIDDDYLSPLYGDDDTYRRTYTENQFNDNDISLNVKPNEDGDKQTLMRVGMYIPKNSSLTLPIQNKILSIPVINFVDEKQDFLGNGTRTNAWLNTKDGILFNDLTFNEIQDNDSLDNLSISTYLDSDIDKLSGVYNSIDLKLDTHLITYEDQEYLDLVITTDKIITLKGQEVMKSLYEGVVKMVSGSSEYPTLVNELDSTILDELATVYDNSGELGIASIFQADGSVGAYENELPYTYESDDDFNLTLISNPDSEDKSSKMTWFDGVIQTFSKEIVRIIDTKLSKSQVKVHQDYIKYLFDSLFTEKLTPFINNILAMTNKHYEWINENADRLDGVEPADVVEPASWIQLGASSTQITRRNGVVYFIGTLGSGSGGVTIPAEHNPDSSHTGFSTTKTFYAYDTANLTMAPVVFTKQPDQSYVVSTIGTNVQMNAITYPAEL